MKQQTACHSTSFPPEVPSRLGRHVPSDTVKLWLDLSDLKLRCRVVRCDRVFWASNPFAQLAAREREPLKPFLQGQFLWIFSIRVPLNGSFNVLLWKKTRPTLSQKILATWKIKQKYGATQRGQVRPLSVVADHRARSALTGPALRFQVGQHWTIGSIIFISTFQVSMRQETSPLCFAIAHCISMMFFVCFATGELHTWYHLALLVLDFDHNGTWLAIDLAMAESAYANPQQVSLVLGLIVDSFSVDITVILSCLENLWNVQIRLSLSTKIGPSGGHLPYRTGPAEKHGHLGRLKKCRAQNLRWTPACMAALLWDSIRISTAQSFSQAVFLSKLHIMFLGVETQPALFRRRTLGHPQEVRLFCPLCITWTWHLHFFGFLIIWAQHVAVCSKFYLQTGLTRKAAQLVTVVTHLLDKKWCVDLRLQTILLVMIHPRKKKIEPLILMIFGHHWVSIDSSLAVDFNMSSNSAVCTATCPERNLQHFPPTQQMLSPVRWSLDTASRSKLQLGKQWTSLGNWNGISLGESLGP